MSKIFKADPDACISCGLCVDDCVAGIIAMENGRPAVAPADEEDCLGCQHCLAVCPTGAVTVNGLSPKDSLSLAEFKPDAAGLDLLVRGRRSVRRFAPEPVPEDLLQRILESTSYAPTGVNARLRRFTVVREAEAMDQFRERSCRALSELGRNAPEEASWLVDLADGWLRGEEDAIFRNAPHFLVASVDKNSPCTEVDGVIALSYFDLLAQANGVGTVWAGMVNALFRLIPQCREWLGIPENHRVAYAILFGMPAVRYARTAQYRPEDAVFVPRLAPAAK